MAGQPQKDRLPFRLLAPPSELLYIPLPSGLGRYNARPSLRHAAGLGQVRCPRRCPRLVPLPLHAGAAAFPACLPLRQKAKGAGRGRQRLGAEPPGGCLQLCPSVFSPNPFSTLDACMLYAPARWQLCLPAGTFACMRLPGCHRLLQPARLTCPGLCANKTSQCCSPC